MNRIIKGACVGFGFLTLTACTSMDDSMETPPATYTYDFTPNYFHEDYQVRSYSYDSPKTVTVPDSYYAGTTQTPVASKDLDKSWVSGQKAQGYTIEIADGEKASSVAQTLMKAPKNERTAQVKYQRAGKTYYKGLYGSYESSEAAQKALEALPASIKQGAGVKNWGVVKGDVGEN